PPQDLVILDAGCGSGYKALALALANPGAKIVGIDFSPNSVELAKKRLEFHQIPNHEFHVLPIEKVGELGLVFDYINCDEVLYLMPDPIATLTVLKQVLKPQGILRVNVHNQYQRQLYFQAQEFFGLLGLMQDNPEEFELKTVQEIMEQLVDKCDLKRVTWNKSYEGELNDKISEFILMNCLLQGDKGFTIPQIFEYLEGADLEFVEMVNWPKWRLKSLFKDPKNLPTVLSLAVEEATQAEILHLVNLLHGGERLLDLWCGHPNGELPIVPQGQAMVSFHPQLRNKEVQEVWQAHLQGGRPLILSKYLRLPAQGPLQTEQA
ncbi:class I SAM-dependent methyltransferase, partial [Gloeomargarita lithophora]